MFLSQHICILLQNCGKPLKNLRWHALLLNQSTDPYFLNFIKNVEFWNHAQLILFLQKMADHSIYARGWVFSFLNSSVFYIHQNFWSTNILLLIKKQEILLKLSARLYIYEKLGRELDVIPSSYILLQNNGKPLKICNYVVSY